MANVEVPKWPRPNFRRAINARNFEFPGLAEEVREHVEMTLGIVQELTRRGVPPSIISMYFKTEKELEEILENIPAYKSGIESAISSADSISGYTVTVTNAIAKKRQILKADTTAKTTVDRLMKELRSFVNNPKINPAANDNEAIQEASSNGHTEVVRLLLADPRVDPAAHNSGSLQYACYRNHTDVIQLLLADPRVDPTVYNNEILKHASYFGRGKKEVVRLLLQDPRVDPTRVSIQDVRDPEIVELLKAAIEARRRAAPSAIGSRNRKHTRKHRSSRRQNSNKKQ
jgi:hypothetical protein